MRELPSVNDPFVTTSQFRTIVFLEESFEPADQSCTLGFGGVRDKATHLPIHENRRPDIRHPPCTKFSFFDGRITDDCLSVVRTFGADRGVD